MIRAVWSERRVPVRARVRYRYSGKGDVCPVAFDENNLCPQADIDAGCPTNTKAMAAGCANADPFGVTAAQLGGFDQFIDVSKAEGVFLTAAGQGIGEAVASPCVDGNLQTICTAETTLASPATALRIRTAINVPVLVRAVAIYPADGYQVRQHRVNRPVPVPVLHLFICAGLPLHTDGCMPSLPPPPLAARRLRALRNPV